MASLGRGFRPARDRVAQIDRPRAEADVVARHDHDAGEGLLRLGDDRLGAALGEAGEELAGGERPLRHSVARGEGEQRQGREKHLLYARCLLW